MYFHSPSHKIPSNPAKSCIYLTHSPLFISVPFTVAHARPMYLYVPDRHRLNWRRYCTRYNACRQPVYFVNAAAVHRRPVAVNRPVVMHPHRDNGRHGGWEDHRRGPNRHDTNNYYRR